MKQQNKNKKYEMSKKTSKQIKLNEVFFFSKKEKSIATTTTTITCQMSHKFTQVWFWQIDLN